MEDECGLLSSIGGFEGEFDNHAVKSSCLATELTGKETFGIPDGVPELECMTGVLVHFCFGNCSLNRAFSNVSC